MKVFISWSGEKSKEVASALKELISDTIQATKVWMSEEDIKSGAIWNNEVIKELGNSPIGIICLTKENLNKPWILFEAGALSKGFGTSQVIPLLVDLNMADIKSPLSQFQSIAVNKQKIEALIKQINMSFVEGQRVNEDTLLRTFNRTWEDFHSRYKKISALKDDAAIKKRSTEEIVSEILDTVRRLDRRGFVEENRGLEKSKIIRDQKELRSIIMRRDAEMQREREREREMYLEMERERERERKMYLEMERERDAD